MSDARDHGEFRTVSQPIGNGPFSGFSFTAIPLIATGASAEECQAKIVKVATEIRELLEAHDGIRMAKGTDETLLALEIAAQVARAHKEAVEKAIAERARNQ